MKLLTATVLIFSFVPSISYSAACMPGTADADGDGLGFEDGRVCTVVKTCVRSDSDPDGDGWGWENEQSCIVTADTASAETLQCVDSDGDGWGWDGQRTCLIETTLSNSTRCVDTIPLNDGWGWDGQRSCRIDSTPGDLSQSVGLHEITDLVVITGQSNALGSNTIVQAGLDDPMQTVFAWTEDGWAVADLHQVWDLGWHPRTTPDGKHPHNNFGLHFGKTVAQNSDRVVAFMLLSAPGRTIAHWDKEQPFFRKIRFQVESALEQLPHLNSVNAILWHQGENDWYGGAAYQQKLTTLIANFRNEHWFSHEGMFICGETFHAPVNADLNRLNKDGDYRTACVSSSGLGVQSDLVHFDAKGLRELGRRYAVKYLDIVNGDIATE